MKQKLRNPNKTAKIFAIFLIGLISLNFTAHLSDNTSIENQDMNQNYYVDSSLISSNYTLSNVNATDFAISGENLYLLTEADGFKTINISNHNRLVELGSCNTPDYANDLYIDGNIAYVNFLNDGLRCINISNPKSPNIIGTYQISGGNQSFALTKYGNIAFLALNGSVTTLNLTNPTNPERVSSYILPGLVKPNITAISQYGSTLITIDSDGLSCLNVSDVISLNEVSNLTIISECRSIELIGSNVFIATDTGLTAINISDVRNPTIIDSTTYDGGFKALGSTWNSLYSAGNGNISLYDITNKRNVSSIFEIPNVNATQLAINGDFLYCMNNSAIRVFRVSRPLSSISKYGEYDALDLTAGDIHVSGDLMYFETTGGLECINISDPESPEAVYKYFTYSPNAEVIAGDLLYVSMDYDIKVYNVSKPHNPVLLTTYNVLVPGLHTPKSLEISGNQLYLGARHKVICIDISDPFNLRNLSTCQLSGSGRLNNIRTSGNFAYVTSQNQGLYILNISDPSHISLVANRSSDGLCFDLEIRGNYAFLGNQLDLGPGSTETLEIFNITNPSNPQKLYGLKTESINYFSISGDFIIAADTGSFHYLNISNLKNIRVVNSEMYQEQIDGMSDIFGDYVAVGSATAGIQIIKIRESKGDDYDEDGLSFMQEEWIYNTNSSTNDTDTDIMTDNYEIIKGLDPLNYSDANLDNDEDNLINSLEFLNGGDPFDNDTDNDDMPDGWEYQYNLNLLINDANTDSDVDGLDNIEELGYGTNPIVSDTDGDGYKDGIEINSGFDPLDPSSHPEENYLVYYIIGAIAVVIMVFAYIRSKRDKATLNIFLSHAVADFENLQIEDMSKYLVTKKPVKKGFICEQDLKFNIDEWMDETVPLCHVLLFYASQKSLFNSPDCAREIKLARSNGLFIVPIKGPDVQWDDLQKSELKLTKGPGFEYSDREYNKLKEQISEYIDQIKEDLDKIEPILKKHNFSDIDILAMEIETNQDRVYKLVRILLETEQVYGAWNDDLTQFLNKAEVSRRIKAYSDLGGVKITDENIEQALKDLGIRSTSLKYVSKILNVKTKNS